MEIVDYTKPAASPQEESDLTKELLKKIVELEDKINEQEAIIAMLRQSIEKQEKTASQMHLKIKVQGIEIVGLKNRIDLMNREGK